MPDARDVSRKEPGGGGKMGKKLRGRGEQAMG
jgi:hypothetical protein